MIKEIEQTGLKYLCKKKQTDNPYDHIRYKGSGVKWNNILNAHPEYTIKTTVIGLYDKYDLVKYGRYYSELWDIVKSQEWANLKIEEGDGGITHKDTHPFLDPMTNKVKYCKECPVGFVSYKPRIPKKICIHNPITKEMKKILTSDAIPAGWVKGGVKGKYAYGPRKGKSEVYNNGNKKIYLLKGQPVPEGFTKGVHYEGTTKNKIGIHNPETGEKRYIRDKSECPVGFVLGLPPTTGKRIITPYGTFITIVQCMNQLNMTRWEIMKCVKSNPEWQIVNENDWQKGTSIIDMLNEIKKSSIN